MYRSRRFPGFQEVLRLLVPGWLLAAMLFFMVNLVDVSFLAGKNLLPWSSACSIAVDPKLRIYVYSDLYEQIQVYDLSEDGRFVGSIPGIVRKGPAGIGVTSDGQVVVCSDQFAKFVSLAGDGKVFKSSLSWPDWRYESSEALTAVPGLEGAGGALASVGEIVCNPHGVKRFAIGDQVEVSLSFLGFAIAKIEDRQIVISAPWFLWLVQAPFPASYIAMPILGWAILMSSSRRKRVALLS